MDPAWAVVVGAAVGAAGPALTGLLAPKFQWQAKRSELDLAYKRDIVASWRSGLAEAMQERDRQTDEAEAKLEAGARHVTTRFRSIGTRTAWFLSLYPHLNWEDEQVRTNVADIADKVDPSMIYEVNVWIDDSGALVLAKEIARIEKAWGLL
ncbi:MULTISPECIES: hypothetical protein [unclassified Dietzia]|uniref:hypothetical protein n=1 Tax=unclassified Dietzia TaxID=2617939 RepID=UPI0015FD146E|nr:MULTISPECIES: hypothetical protein [unclassified Dietzia]MBB1025068.1 hypothetical protein [Dietzia sp. DQ12-76]MBB1028882.1 hypothetical protein [Dietzia sp. DQ11-38-2]